ncbi:MAG: carbamoyl-phosphate synthase, small subunit [Acidimicrobiaceae bacterium]|nr:carbamoyl-phosphate synthase, small subunit [Acidimicrobiaceae bacterium]
MSRPIATLILGDGTTFEGYAAGYLPPSGFTSGEFVFNTALSGYQEVLTDPSYAGQIISFTYPHIGNYGVTPVDDEAVRPWCRGVVVRELSDVASNWRSRGGLEDFLRGHQIPAIVGVDTRRLTRHLRAHGALPGAFGHGDAHVVRRAASEARGTEDGDFVTAVSTREPYTRGEGDLHVVALDYGVKATMVRELARRFRVTVVPAGSSAEEILNYRPDGVFLSNGPGDPAALGAQVAVLESIVGRLPVFGICLGHQLLADALGGTTFKLPFGHHGSNHPVQDLSTGRIEITAQNHNYAVVPDSLERAVVSHVNLNDGVIEGISAPSERCFSVQYHPEAGPGPHDARYLFERFETLLRTNSIEES